MYKRQGVVSFRFLQNVVSGEIRLALSGAGLLVVLYALPGGLGQAVYAVRDRGLRVIARRRGIHVPSLIADSRVEAAPDADTEPHLTEAPLAVEPLEEVRS